MKLRTICVLKNLHFFWFFSCFASENLLNATESMFRSLNIILMSCVVAIVQSCSGHSTMDSRLFYADSLANENLADSAMSVLRSVDYESLDEWNNHYYDLLTVKFDDKACIPHQSDSLIIDVINYFEKSDDYAELTAALYYGGRVYSDLNNTPQALDLYRKAYSRLDESPSSLKGRIAYQMGIINLDLYHFTEAKSKFHEAIEFHRIMKDSIEIVHCYSSLADAMRQSGYGDSTYYYLKEAVSLAHEILPYGVDEMEARSQLVQYYLGSANLDSAYHEFEFMAEHLVSGNTTDYTLIAGLGVYMATNKLAKAENYAKQLALSQSIHNRQDAFATLFEIATARGHYNHASYYSEMYKMCVDSINSLYAAETNKLRNSLFHYSIREEQHITDTNKKSRRSMMIYILVGFIFITLVAVILWYYYHNKRLMRQSAIQLEKIEHLLAKTSTPIEDESLSPAEQLQTRLEEIINNVNPKDVGVADEILTSEVYKKLKYCIYSDMEVKPDAEDWQMLDEVVNQVHPTFKSTLYSLCNKMSQYEYNVCLLVKCKFSPSEMAMLTFHSKSSIASTRSRLCGKFFCYDGLASDCDKFILSL